MSIYRKSKIEKDIKALRSMRKNFVVEKAGSFTKLCYDKKTVTYAEDRFGGIKGAHLSKMVKADVEELIPMSSIPREDAALLDNHPPSVYVHLPAVEESINDYVYHIDISNCYWTVALREGVISKRTYIMGLRKREWKLGRNAAIGSLDKKIVRDEYVNGEIVNSERLHQPANFVYARMKIINKVDSIAKDAIYNVLGKGFVMFLTDCFCVKGPYVSKLVKYLQDNGYGYSTAGVVIKNFMPGEKRIEWDKIETVKQNNTGQRFLKHDNDKFIHYTERGIVRI